MVTDKEISIYKTNCVSLESTKDFLESKGETLDSFVMKTISAMDLTGEIALWDLAEKAIELGAKYVTNVKHIGTTEAYISGQGFFVKYITPPAVALAGTALIPKK
ncbi:MAG: hypothetical protein KJ939_04900 [Nanoarchaeota archaeon]|nr:hypothetical protein [Nanoarchaeota archaeon]